LQHNQERSGLGLSDRARSAYGPERAIGPHSLDGMLLELTEFNVLLGRATCGARRGLRQHILHSSGVS
jgi:hypothetical protein